VPLSCRGFLSLAALPLLACGGLETPMHYDLFILGGQSNMFGADAVIDGTDKTLDLDEAGLQTTADTSALFRLGGPTYTYAWGEIIGHQGTSFGVDNVATVPIQVHGPEVGLNRTLYAAATTPLAITKYANNFAALESGRSPWVSPGSLWTAWQAEVDDALADLVSLGHTYTVVGFCWAQGIDDGLLARSQVDYEADLRDIIADLRTKFGASIPFILSRSVNSSIVGSTDMAPIRAGQVAVAADANNAWVDLDDLTPYVNTHHLSAASQIIHGNRMAAQYLALAPVDIDFTVSVKVAGALVEAPLYVKESGSLVRATISAG
jgi:hypothetical protein